MLKRIELHDTKDSIDWIYKQIAKAQNRGKGSVTEKNSQNLMSSI
jgi:hypothetical protein